MKRLYRSRHNRAIAGVSAGLADYFHIDPVIVRLVLLFGLIVSGLVPLAVAYLCAIFIVPLEPEVTIHDADDAA